MNRFAALLLASLFALLPGTALPQEEKPKQDPPKKEGAPQDDLKERAQKFKKDVTETRGMKFKNEVTVGVYTKDELLKFLKKEFERESPREKVEMWAKVYRHFGLVPKDLDLYQAYLDLFGSSIAGFYHPKTKELYLIRSGEDDENKGMDEMFKQQFGVTLEDVTLVHELNHAAQDQNHELSSLPLDDETNDDMIAAIKGLIEGDASAVGWKWGLKDKYAQIIGAFNDQYKKGMLPGKAAKLPVYMRKTLTFSYGHGTDFVNDVLRNANEEWSAIDKAFNDPPLSTEQILHPKKFYGAEKDWPKAVDVKDADKLAGEGWKRLATNVFGEFGVAILFEEFRIGSARERRKTSEGWGGDRYYAYEKGDKTASIWVTNWDTNEDAVEFFDMYVKLLEKKYEKATKAAADLKVTFTWEGGSAVIERKDADVVVVDGLTASGSDILAGATKKEFSKIERYKLVFSCPKHTFLKSHKAGKCDICDAELLKGEGK